MSSSTKTCRHSDVRQYDGLRCCLECGAVIFESSIAQSPVTSTASQSIDFEGPFIYNNLNFELGQEIRLVEVLPGERSDPVRCEIVHVNLQHCPNYEAVSYTWATECGDSTKSRVIYTTNNKVIKVTVNCEAALRRLRYPGLRRYLWVDSICIDQDNIKERNHQVGLMDQIFSVAKHVLICIQVPENFSLFLRWLQHGSSPERAEKKARRFLGLRYFRRVWIIQEVALSRAAFLIVNEDIVLLSSAVLHRLRQMCCKLLIDIPPALHWDPGTRPKADIITCLYASANCALTEPRDRLYAILSLLRSSVRSLIPVDYSLDNRTTVTSVIVASIKEYHDLRILSYLNFAPEWSSSGFGLFHIHWKEEMRYTLPPQFLEEEHGPWKSRIQIDETQGHTMCIPDAPSSSFELTHNPIPRLKVRAHHIGTVVQFFSTFMVDPDLLTGVRDFADSNMRWINRYFQDPEQSELGGINKQRLRTFLDCVISSTNKPEYPTIFGTCHSIGFSMGKLNEQDTIFAIDGCRNPFILRKVGEGQYAIVSECVLENALSLDPLYIAPETSNTPLSEMKYWQTCDIELF